MPETPDQYGDMIILNGAKVAVPPRIGKDNARMIVQPYVINNSKGKKVEMYRLPRVYDGSQYYLTQDRRMGYDLSLIHILNGKMIRLYISLVVVLMISLVTMQMMHWEQIRLMKQEQIHYMQTLQLMVLRIL